MLLFQGALILRDLEQKIKLRVGALPCISQFDRRPAWSALADTSAPGHECTHSIGSSGSKKFESLLRTRSKLRWVYRSSGLQKIVRRFSGPQTPRNPHISTIDVESMAYFSSRSGGLRASLGFLSHACGALVRRTFLSSSKVFDSIARLYLQFGG